MLKLNSISARVIVLSTIVSSLLGGATLPKSPCDPALVRIITNAQGRVVQEYADWASGALEAPLKKLWEHQLGVSLHGQTESTLPYLTPKGVVLDSLISLSSAGDNVVIDGKLPFAESHEVLGRNINRNQPASLVLLDEASWRALGRDREREIRKLAGLADGAPLPTVFVFRRWSRSAGPSALSDSMPQVVEVMTFPQAATRANSDISVVVGNEALVQKLMQQRSFQSQFLGSTYRAAFHDFLNRETPAEPARKAQNVHTGAERLGRLLDPPYHDAERHAHGFEQRDPEKTIDLGTANPNVELDARILDRTKNTPSKERARLGTAVKTWYATHYDTKIDPEKFLVTDGAMGALWQVMASLKPGSRLLLPDPGYYAYEAMAKALGHRIIRYPNFEGELALPPGDVAAQADVVIVNFPHNPSGKVMTTEQRKRLQALAGRGVLILNDLTFPEAAYDGKKVGSLLEGAKSHDNLLEIFGASKDLGLPEERIAALIGDQKRLDTLRAGPFEQASGISSQRMSMFGSVLRDPTLRISGAKDIARRRDLVISAFREAGWPADAIQTPEAGLNLMLKAPPGLGANEFAQEIWERAGVFVNPGDYLTDSVKARDSHVRITLTESSAGLERLKAALDSGRIRWDGFRSDNVPRLLDKLRGEKVRSEDGTRYNLTVTASPHQKTFDLVAVNPTTGERTPLWIGQNYYRSGDLAATAQPIPASSSPSRPGGLDALPLFGKHLAKDTRLSLTSPPAEEGPRRWMAELGRASKRDEFVSWLEKTRDGRAYLATLLAPHEKAAERLARLRRDDAAVKEVAAGLFDAFSPEAEKYFANGFIVDDHLLGVEHLRLNPELAAERQRWRARVREKIPEPPAFLTGLKRNQTSPDARLEALAKTVAARAGVPGDQAADGSAYHPRVYRTMGAPGALLERLSAARSRSLLTPAEVEELAAIERELPRRFLLP